MKSVQRMASSIYSPNEANSEEHHLPEGHGGGPVLLARKETLPSDNEF